MHLKVLCSILLCICIGQLKVRQVNGDERLTSRNDGSQFEDQQSSSDSDTLESSSETLEADYADKTLAPDVQMKGIVMDDYINQID
uniref:Uncharacterized protein n=1 Tax=Trichuris muris TaxID=70415 RepID=A0A5S6QRC5_TRIMR